MSTEDWVDNRPIIEQIVFEFLTTYGPFEGWDREVKNLFEEEISKRIIPLVDQQ